MKLYSLGYRVSFGATFMEFWSFIEEIWPKQYRVETCFCLQIFPHADNFTEKDSITVLANLEDK